MSDSSIEEQDSPDINDAMDKSSRVLDQAQQQGYSSQYPGRVLCDSCPPESAQPAVFYCRQCKGNFCESCDAQYHPQHNKLMGRHVRVPIESSKAFLFCSEHPDEELSYYCLTCEGSCICSECAIRGAHKGHDVQTIKKSYVEVRKRMNEIVTSLTARQESVKKVLGMIEEHKQEIMENTRQIKESMMLSFNELREKIRKKEMEFLASADKFQEDQIADLQSYVAFAQQKQSELTESLNELKDASESTDTVAVLNFYGAMKPKALELLTDTPIDIQLPEVASRRCYLNMDSANKQLEGLSALHLAIASVQANYTSAPESGNMGGTLGQSFMAQAPPQPIAAPAAAPQPAPAVYGGGGQAGMGAPSGTPLPGGYPPQYAQPTQQVPPPTTTTTTTTKRRKKRVTQE